MVILAMALAGCVRPLEVAGLPGEIAEVRVLVQPQERGDGASVETPAILWLVGAGEIAKRDGYRYVPPHTVGNSLKPSREEVLARQELAANNDVFDEYARRLEILMQAEDEAIAKLQEAFLITPTRSFRWGNVEVPALNGTPSRPLVLEVTVTEARIGGFPVGMQPTGETVGLVFASFLGAGGRIQEFEGRFRILDAETSAVVDEGQAPYRRLRDGNGNETGVGDFQIFADRIWYGFLTRR
ncbi:MAG: hypothetical protein AAF577_14370 [Pseudomonadota bacterium]